MMRVLDLSPRPAAGFATMLLARLGAEVVTVEPPAAEGARPVTPPSGYSTTERFLGAGKERVALDLRSGADRSRLLEMVREADAVVESLGPEGLRERKLRFHNLKRVNPRIVLTSISGFGRDGPRADWMTTELVAQAMGGVLHATGWEEGPPYRLPGLQTEYIAGLNAAIATLTAVFGIRNGRTRGVHIDLAVQETFAPQWSRHVARAVYGGLESSRPARGADRQTVGQVEQAADGWLLLHAPDAPWQDLAALLGLERFASAAWGDPERRAEQQEAIEEEVQAAVAQRERHDWVAAAAAAGFAFAPVEGPEALLANPQFAARGFLRPVELADGRMVPAPGLPFTVRDGAGDRSGDGE